LTVDKSNFSTPRCRTMHRVAGNASKLETKNKPSSVPARL
jgi:hypothetical protein